MSAPVPSSTSDPAYAQRLSRLARRGGVMRRVIDPQLPYRWNLRHLHPGLVLDIGCGIGRNLKHLDGHGVGVDHNEECVRACVAEGLTAYTPEEFSSSADAVAEHFDSLLVSHVVEHLTDDEAVELINTYMPYVRSGGRVIIITPQERGQASDPTHVQLIDGAAIRRLAKRLHLRVESVRSFPFTRLVGRVFTYNETVATLVRPSGN
ncbi:MAG TPA: methyltransferase domain-containing protein [Ilumatobacteraceae bacterium]